MSSIKKILFDYKYFSFFLLLIIVFNILLLFLPLTKVFGYEFSLLNSLLLSFFSGVYTIIVLKKNNQTDANKNKFIKILLYSFTAFLFFPAIISIVHSLLTINCSLWEGFQFYLVLTVPSVLIGSSLGIFVKVFGKRFFILKFILLYILILLVPLFEFYFNPQIFFYNPLFGYYPGTIYDEGISVDLKLAVYRSLNIIFFALLFYFSYNIYFKLLQITRKSLFTLSFLISILFIYLSPGFGYSTDFHRMTNYLNREIETPHFLIHYSDSINESLAKSIALHHEYYYEQLTFFFRTKMDKKINSFIFKDSQQKKELLGTENADVAKPWLNQSFTVYNNYDATLRHELAHVISSKFGTGIFKVAENINPSLIEGVAVAADPFYSEYDIHYMAALAYKNGFKINIKNLFSGYSFLTNTSSLSYIYAGSFVKYLIENYGINKVKKLYSNIDFEKIYKMPVSRLESEYYDFLKSIIADNKNSAYYFFGRQSLFTKVCPRYISSRLKDGWENYQAKNYKKSEKIFQEILDVSINFSALVGMSNSLNELGKTKEAIGLLDDNINVFKNTAYYYTMEFQLADLLAKNDYIASADSLYNILSYQNPNRTLFNLAKLRTRIIPQDTLLPLYLKSDAVNKYLILDQINQNDYVYYSFPAVVELSKTLKENYDIFISKFKRTLIVNDYRSSYAVFKLSAYMLENLDFTRARKMAALSMRYTGDTSFEKLQKENYKKCTWMYFHGNKFLQKFLYK